MRALKSEAELEECARRALCGAIAALEASDWRSSLGQGARALLELARLADVEAVTAVFVQLKPICDAAANRSTFREGSG